MTGVHEEPVEHRRFLQYLLDLETVPRRTRPIGWPSCSATVTARWQTVRWAVISTAGPLNC
ncbi:hypothetical protein BZB76_1517 [Actinomadura pelletieri DSM 43383]|uniref:Uncharacterized protein n=1 Tax=Actinomadura pelletieri DSM 43383 TaxID=1120940 RepID=A0A495QRS4_9ACTN|nr:hypothetical protein BZB76_1517 [Actinomadura pelletieri DSM 43383]